MYGYLEVTFRLTEIRTDHGIWVSTVTQGEYDDALQRVNGDHAAARESLSDEFWGHTFIRVCDTNTPQKEYDGLLREVLRDRLGSFDTVHRIEVL